MKTIKFFAAIGIIAVILSSCTGKDGATGPTGANGVANINTSNFTIYSWSGGSGIYYSVNTLPINSTNGAVLVYIENPSFTGDWYALPESDWVVAGDQFAFDVYDGSVITFDYRGPYTNTPAPGTQTFQVVVIPPAVMKQHPNTNWKDYSQVNAIIEMQNTFKK